FFHEHDNLRALRSFPTRRSSDLAHALASLRAQEPPSATTEPAGSSSERDVVAERCGRAAGVVDAHAADAIVGKLDGQRDDDCPRSEEHTSELQSQSNLVCRLLLE